MTKRSQIRNVIRSVGGASRAVGSLLVALGSILSALAFCTASLAAEGDPAAGKRKTVTCNGCHGQAGMKNMPSLGGQNAAYFVLAMQAYQDGIRTHATMRDVAKAYSLQDLKNFAAHYSESATSSDSASESVRPPAAERCAACHGNDGRETVTKDIPRLAGQKTAYLGQALREYRAGTRKHAIMQPQATDLSDDDITALALYYSALPGLTVK